jgi:predicted nucleic acid-binding protein
MLLIYLLEGNPFYKKRVRHLLDVAYSRKDRVLTSCLAAGEILTGFMKAPAEERESLENDLADLRLEYLPFDQGAIKIFASLRSQKIKAADAIHLACAGSVGVDLFLTGDRQLLRLEVPGIRFIADFETPFV